MPGSWLNAFWQLAYLMRPRHDWRLFLFNEKGEKLIRQFGGIPFGSLAWFRFSRLFDGWPFGDLAVFRSAI